MRACFALPKSGASDYRKGMIGGVRMRNGLLLLAGAAVLAGCSMEIPSFMGREGDSGNYNFNLIGKHEAPPQARPVQLRQAVAERALFGVIVRVTGEAPTQGYSTAQLVPVG